MQIRQRCKKHGHFDIIIKGDRKYTIRGNLKEGYKIHPGKGLYNEGHLATPLQCLDEILRTEYEVLEKIDRLNQNLIGY